jgi:hypothetical protein
LAVTPAEAIASAIAARLMLTVSGMPTSPKTVAVLIAVSVTLVASASPVTMTTLEVVGYALVTAWSSPLVESSAIALLLSLSPVSSAALLVLVLVIVVIVVVLAIVVSSSSGAKERVTQCIPPWQGTKYSKPCLSAASVINLCTYIRMHI